jgi:hypothetical protein
VDLIDVEQELFELPQKVRWYFGSVDHVPLILNLNYSGARHLQQGSPDNSD